MKKYSLFFSLILGTILLGADCTPLTRPFPPTNSPSSTVSTPSTTKPTPSKPAQSNKRYIGDPDLCMRIKFVCEDNEHYFSDAQGCGCETTTETPDKPQPDRDVCTMEYKPVCGEKTVYCIRAPCPPIKQTYSNRCEAEEDKALNIVDGACS